jgi:hypothetical protein
LDIFQVQTALFSTFLHFIFIAPILHAKGFSKKWPPKAGGKGYNHYAGSLFNCYCIDYHAKLFDKHQLPEKDLII